MQKPATPARENSRLEALRQYTVLDTLPEKLFDNITLIASQICGTPIALISLIDEKRQWFKSRIGLDATETLRDLSFCGHAILETGVFEIRDATLDPRFSDNPLVTSGPKVGFYAGAPIRTPAGEQIGTLCVIDKKSRTLNEDQRASLEALADQVVALLELRRSELNQRDITHQLEVTITRLEEERELRDRFVSALTHDLRTPMTAIKLSAQMLNRAAGDAATVRRYASRIDSNVDRSDRMILNLLDANRLKAGESLPLVKSDCSVQELSVRVIQQLAEVHGDRFTLVSPEEQILARWDAPAVERALENLMSNAIKYGEPHTPVTLTVTPVDPRRVQLAVHNLGNVIPEANRSHLFKPYHRSESAEAGGQKGWGIGLMLVHAVATEHGGTVTCESSLELGTTFTLELPLRGE